MALAAADGWTGWDSARTSCRTFLCFALQVGRSLKRRDGQRRRWEVETTQQQNKRYPLAQLPSSSRFWGLANLSR
jgi:hypothetical protein